MHRAAWVIVALGALSCGQKDPAPAPAPGSGSGSGRGAKKPLPLGVVEGSDAYVTPPTPPQAQLDKIGAAKAEPEDLIAITGGAILQAGPPAAAVTQSPWFLLDEDVTSKYGQHGAKAELPPVVIALSDEAQLELVTLDYARVGRTERVPQRLRVEASEDGKAWAPVIDEEVRVPPADKVRVLPKAPVAARFVRLALAGSHADAKDADDQQELDEVRISGKRLSHDPPPSATGTYDIAGVGKVHLRQTGSTVTGCIDKKQTAISGGFDGRVLRFALAEPAAADSGPVVMTFGAGRAFWGMWAGGIDAHALMSAADGPKLSDDPGKCPGDPKRNAIAADLAAAGRARLYGVVFDAESDTLRDDAKPTLDQLVAVMKAQPALAIRIEAHTDAAATPPHNLILSGKQTVAVRQYLVGAGIDAKRIQMKAMGATAAIAQDGTPLGRAQNRRIEIVKTSP